MKFRFRLRFGFFLLSDVKLFQYHFLKWFSFLHLIAFAHLSKYNLNIFVWVYFWFFYSVPLIYMSILLPIPDTLDYSSYMIFLEIEKTDPSHFTFPFKHYFSSMDSFAFPYYFRIILSISTKNVEGY